MWHYLRKKRCKLWLWKALDRDTGQLLDWECGRRDKATLKKRANRLAQWDVKLYCTDKWATYAAIIPSDKLVQSKGTTHDIERNHVGFRPACVICEASSIYSVSKLTT
jgi:IS1 family transposase